MRKKEEKRLQEKEEILLAIAQVQRQLEAARNSFETVTDETLIDSCIYEIIALQKKYVYFLKTAREMGLTNGYGQVV